MRSIERYGVAAMLALVAGCASTPPGGGLSAPEPQSTQPQPQPQVQQRRPPDRNLSGFSVAFREGYVDGCSSGRNGGTRRDEGRYKLDLDYVMGWNDGFSVCRR